MKNIFLPAIIASIFLIACNSNKNNSFNSGIDTTRFNPPVITKDTPNVLEKLFVTPSEMEDDSVFADGSIPTSWENAGITDVKGFKLFLKQIQLWVMDNDKEKLSQVIRYPIKNIKTAQAFIAEYDVIFTKPVKLSLATINFNQIYRNSQGAMTEGGKVWFAQQGKEFKIISVNN